MNRLVRVLCSVLVAVPLFSEARVSEAQVSEAQAPATNEKVPTIQGNAGPCALELTVLGTDRKAVYAASVKVHIKYGFGGMRRLDLEAGTNSEGKGKFSGRGRPVSC